MALPDTSFDHYNVTLTFPQNRSRDKHVEEMDPDMTIEEVKQTIAENVYGGQISGS